MFWLEHQAPGKWDLVTDRTIPQTRAPTLREALLISKACAADGCPATFRRTMEDINQRNPILHAVELK